MAQSAIELNTADLIDNIGVADALNLIEGLFPDEQPTESVTETEKPESEETETVEPEVVEETPEKAEETTEEETEPEGDEETVPEEAEEKEPEKVEEDEPKDLKGMRRRIDKLTAQKYEAMEKLEATEAKVKDLEARLAAGGEPVPVPEVPLANLNTEAEVIQLYQKAQQAKQWALQNLDGAEVEQENGEKIFRDSKYVQTVLANAERIIDTDAPSRYQYLKQRDQWMVVAKAEYPNLITPGTQENQELRAVIRQCPQLQRFPELVVWVGDALMGRKIRESKSKDRVAKKPVAKPLSSPKPSSAKASSKPTAKRVGDTNVAKRLINADRGDLADDIGSMLGL
jgi:hypothetical protein